MARGGKRTAASTTPSPGGVYDALAGPKQRAVKGAATGPPAARKGGPSSKTGPAAIVPANAPARTRAQLDELACVLKTAASASADICADFASSRGCLRGAACRKRHTLAVPACGDYALGVCTRPACRYRHTKVCTVPSCPRTGCPCSHPHPRGRDSRHTPTPTGPLVGFTSSGKGWTDARGAKGGKGGSVAWPPLEDSDLLGAGATCTPCHAGPAARYVPSGKRWAPPAGSQIAAVDEASALWELPSAPRAAPVRPIDEDDAAPALPPSDPAAGRLEAQHLFLAADEVWGPAEDALRQLWAQFVAEGDAARTATARSSMASRWPALRAAEFCHTCGEVLPPPGPRRDAHHLRHIRAFAAGAAVAAFALAEEAAADVAEEEAGLVARLFAPLAARLRHTAKEEAARRRGSEAEAAKRDAIVRARYVAHAALVAARDGPPPDTAAAVSAAPAVSDALSPGAAMEGTEPEPASALAAAHGARALFQDAVRQAREAATAAADAAPGKHEEAWGSAARAADFAADAGDAALEALRQLGSSAAHAADGAAQTLAAELPEWAAEVAQLRRDGVEARRREAG
jgi:hypothetical protein